MLTWSGREDFYVNGISQTANEVNDVHIVMKFTQDKNDPSRLVPCQDTATFFKKLLVGREKTEKATVTRICQTHQNYYKGFI
jgi:hypothetical protein